MEAAEKYFIQKNKETNYQKFFGKKNQEVFGEKDFFKYIPIRETEFALWLAPEAQRSLQTWVDTEKCQRLEQMVLKTLRSLNSVFRNCRINTEFRENYCTSSYELRKHSRGIMDK